MDILLTGARGFVGSHLLARLRGAHRVIPLVRTSIGDRDEVVSDLAEPLARARLPRRVDLVIHAAGLVGAEANGSSLCRRVNVDATRELADYAAHAGASRFMLFSTGGVYRPSRAPLTETSPLGPIDAYTQSKLDAEDVVAGFGGRFAAQVLRPFFPYGPGQRARLVPTLLERIVGERAIQLPELDRPVLTPIFVADLVDQVERLVERRDSFTVNLAGREATTVRAIAETLATRLGRPIRFKLDAGLPAGDWRGDAAAACALSGLEPRTTLHDGLARTIADDARWSAPAMAGGEALHS